jgi:Flp pilus assembly protein TadD
LPAGWLLLALALPPAEPERVIALEQALALDPDSFLALSELAQRRCAAGQCREAVSLAEKAARLAPEDVRVWASYATVLAKAGQCAEAVSVKERAREVLGHRAKAAPVPLASCEGS